MENYEIVKCIEDYTLRLSELEKAVDLDGLNKNIDDDNKLMLDPSFYNDMMKAQKVLKRVKHNQDIIKKFSSLRDLLEEINFYFDLHKSGEENLEKEIEEDIKTLGKDLSDFEVEMLLNKEYDHCDAIMELHPGAGGTEAQDWAEMLFRMYNRYSEAHGFEFEVVDYLAGEEAGIKSVTFIVHGDNAYGYLKSERGVHRLVRISPFDANARRHTSFCSCTVIPQVDMDVNIEIKPEDIKIDTYRASGAGGQHVNKTDSAIRITHLKTGIVVTCQNERSQIQNREKAMAVLKSKLYQLELEEKEKEINSINTNTNLNSFGSQIRSYVFHPYSMVKDHRTNFENFSTENVMNGDIDGFINAYLKSEYNVR